MSRKTTLRVGERVRLRSGGGTGTVISVTQGNSSHPATSAAWIEVSMDERPENLGRRQVLPFRASNLRRVESEGER